MTEIFLALLEKGDSLIHLPAVWATLTALLKGRAEVDGMLDDLEEVRAAVRRSFAGRGGDTPNLLADFNQFFVGELGFRGNQAFYADPANHFLDDVLTKRLGIPITLSILYMELGRACGLAFEPIGFPGHFLVREVSGRVLCDPFHGRIGLVKKDLLAILTKVFRGDPVWTDQFLAVSTRFNVVVRMLNNLQNCFAAKGDMKRLATAENLLKRLAKMEIPPPSMALN